MKNDNLAIIIVTWNSKAIIENCLNSIKKINKKVHNHIYIVDNNSKDRIEDLFKKKNKNLTFIKNTENKGFSKANNQILKQIKEKYVLLLNPDTVVYKSSIEALLRLMESDKKIGACGGILVDRKGNIQKGFYRKFPSIIQTFLFYTDLYRFLIKIPLLVNNFWDEPLSEGSLSEVDQIPGACLMTRKDILKQVGYLNEDYFIWFEDVELCYKIKNRGYKLVCTPESKIMHLGGHSFDQWSDRASKESRFWISFFKFYKNNKSIIALYVIKYIILFNFIFQILSRYLMQIVSYNKDRGKFIKLKFDLIKNVYLSLYENS